MDRLHIEKIFSKILFILDAYGFVGCSLVRAGALLVCNYLFSEVAQTGFFDYSLSNPLHRSRWDMILYFSVVFVFDTSTTPYCSLASRLNQNQFAG